MRHCLFILIVFLSVVSTAHAQRSGRSDRGGFSLSTLSGSGTEIPDSLLVEDSIPAKRITAFRLTPDLGTPYIAPMDTQRLNSSQHTLVEGRSLAVGYLANLGSPAQTKIFSERKESRDFIFADAYDYYIIDPLNAYYYDTKIPYTDITYTTAGANISKEERLKGVLTSNFGKKINAGVDGDYIYSRGYYNSNGNKLMSYRIFGSYKSDKYDMHAYLSNFNFVNNENGGITNDEYVTNPDEFSTGKNAVDSREFPVRMYNTWNRNRGKQYYLSHRYHLGFNHTIEEQDEDGEVYDKDIFVPVSSIIHTMEYQDNRRHLYSAMDTIDNVYNNVVYGLDDGLSDRTSTWNLKNTVALSLREGFQDWVKFGLTAYARFEKRRFKLPAKVPGVDYDGISRDEAFPPLPPTLDYKRDEIYDEFSTYIGAELAKRQGALFTFNARGELAIIGDDLGEFRLDGDIQSRFRLFKKDASVKATGYFRNVTPAFYQRHFHSRYFWWDNSFNNIQQFYVGGGVNLASTGTTFSAGVESIQNYVYFNSSGYAAQHGSNLQVVTLRLKQDFRYRALAWENEVAYQLSSDQDILPLPELSAYSNLYLHFRLFNVLTMQLGADIHYHTRYYAPYYEPATQQFQLQREDNRVKVGNYPLMNAYVNLHLKQARFFVMGYNLSELFVEPNYFSLPHYPLNPMVLKIGVAVMFNN